MKYSIIVPVYNTEKYISQCIDSVRNQIFSDWELWLIDDESKDTSGEICDRYETKDSRVHCIHKKNEGPLEARKCGIEHAKGEICLFLDSDDYWEKDLLKYVNEVFTARKTDVVVFNTIHLYQNKKIEDPILSRNNEKKISGKIMISRMLEDTRLGSMAMKAVRRSKLLEVNQMVSTDSCQGEDLYQSIALGLVCENFYFMEKNLYYYRQRRSSSCHGVYQNRVEEHFKVRNEIEQLLRDYDIIEDNNWVNMKRTSLIYIAECIFNENNYTDTVKNRMDRLDEMRKWDEVEKLLQHLSSSKLVIYQRVRLTLFKNRQFALLYIMDKCLMAVKMILQKIKKKEMFI